MDNKILTCKFCQQKMEKTQIWAHQNSCQKRQIDGQQVQPQQIKEQQNRAVDLQFINKYLDIVEQYEEILEKGEQLFQSARYTHEKYTNQTQKVCIICQEGFHQDVIFILLHCCSSGFHKECFNQKLRQSTKCYHCKQAIFLQNS